MVREARRGREVDVEGEGEGDVEEEGEGKGVRRTPVMVFWVGWEGSEEVE